jgi:hypothetical protein
LIGIDYPAVKLIADCLGVEITPRVLGKLQALEKATLKKVNKTPK